MVRAERDAGTWYLPAEPTEVCDVCGAGDTVLAAIGATMLAGHSQLEACKCASVAACHQVSQQGISNVPTVANPSRGCRV